MSPALFLLLMLAITAAALTVQRLIRWRRGTHLRDLARRSGMHYSPGDRFRLADRVAAHFPLCGAANVRVVDLMYGIDEADYRYLFTIEYTQGVIRTKRRMRQVGGFVEPRSSTNDAVALHLRLAPPDLPLIEQYQHLLDKPQ